MPSSVPKQPYRRDQGAKIDAIEQRRKRAGVEIRELCDRAGVSEETYRRMRRSRLAFPRQATALAMALRAIERDRRLALQTFPVEG